MKIYCKARTIRLQDYRDIFSRDKSYYWYNNYVSLRELRDGFLINNGIVDLPYFFVTDDYKYIYCIYDGEPIYFKIFEYSKKPFSTSNKYTKIRKLIEERNILNNKIKELLNEKEIRERY